MRPKFVLFGDSITQQSFLPGGWGSSLADLYCRKADVVLRGYSGYNTRWALFLLDKIFPTKDRYDAPAVVTVFFGANDAALPGKRGGRQHVPSEEYKQNLHRIIAHLKGNSNHTLVVLITPPPIDEEGRIRSYGGSAPDLPERTNAAAGKYARCSKAVAEEAGVPVIDIWSKMQETDGWQQIFLDDGLHLTCAGNGVIFQELVKLLTLKGLGVDKLPLDCPEFSEVDADDPKKTFTGCT
eukprot:TRINITY_DN1360_c0_g1_i3.p1 TRINITY_DN1360_c0_g1~~TRINITY_DN1360_c0_g1_i3.p1  ORF type:complete len:239 (+),score=47.51 TRINITY_DN1360_c0_g1_i3:199-915(+)